MKDGWINECVTSNERIGLLMKNEPVHHKRLLTIVGVQEAQQSVQKVLNDCPELLSGGAVDQLLRPRRMDRVQGLADGAQSHSQTLHCMVSQVQLQLQLDAVLVGGENTLVLLHHLVWFP